VSAERSNWKVKKLDDIDERNIRTSLYDSLIAFYKENYSYSGEAIARQT